MTKLIERIDTPADLKSLSDEELQQVAQEVREQIIDVIGRIGGHFGANLGTCELAVALHSLMDSPTAASTFCGSPDCSVSASRRASANRPSPARIATSSPNATWQVGCPRRSWSSSIAGRSSWISE